MVTELEAVLSKWPQIKFDLLFVDDGSTDNSVTEIQEVMSKTFLDCRLIILVRNFGSYNSFFAGLENTRADAYIYLHSDGEDPPQLIHELLSFWQQGFKFVIAHRSHREDIGLLKPFSILYHYIMNQMMPRKLPEGGFDLVLFGDEVKNEVLKIQEKNINLVYLIAWLGYPYAAVPYTRKKRKSGYSQWTFLKKTKLVIDSILGFSYAPIRIVWYIGLALLFVALFNYVINSNPSLLLTAISLSTSIILLALGVIGEYVWRVFEQVRNRPVYIIDKEITNRDNKS